MKAIERIFGTHSERELKRVYPIVDKIESYRPAMMELSDEQLKDKTKEFKKRLEEGETLDDILPEAYATVREAARKSAWHGALPGTADRRCDFTSGSYFRDEDR